MNRAVLAALSFVVPVFAFGQNELTGVTFAGDPTLYVPLRKAGKALGYPIGYADGKASIAYREVEEIRKLPNGAALVPARAFEAAGATVDWDAGSRTAIIANGNSTVRVAEGDKRVVVDKSRQILRAYQGDLLVLETPISSGREGHRTPNGTFQAGPYKARMHHSTLYNDAPMPWSIQVVGNIFLHGYATVPDVPASHGCIRLPTDGPNPARWLYQWVEIGTPITIEGRWKGGD